MGKPKARLSLDSAKPKAASIRSESSVVCSHGRKFFDNVKASVLTGMGKRANAPSGIKVIREWQTRLISRGMTTKVEGAAEISKQEDEMEEVVISLMKPPVSTIA